MFKKPEFLGAADKQGRVAVANKRKQRQELSEE
jgi:hypothetical protein